MISPIFHLPSGRGRVELLTRTKKGILPFSAISNEGGFLCVTNESSLAFMTIKTCITKIGRAHQRGFFETHIGEFVSGDHCEIVVLNKDPLDNSIDFVIRNRGAAQRNGTYYHYHISNE